MNQYNVRNIRIDPSVFQHPMDKQATQSVQSNQAFQKALKWISENSVERVVRQLNHSSRARVTPSVSPKLTRMIAEGCEMFGVGTEPELYLDRSYQLSMRAQGIKQPQIVMSTEFLKHLDERELWGMIACVTAGIRSGYCEITFVEELCKCGLLPDILVIPLTSLFNVWHKYAQFSFDRAALIATGDFNVTMRAIMAGEAPKNILANVNFSDPDCAYMKQAREFLQQTDGVTSIARTAKAMSGDGIFYVSRYIDLFHFYQSEYYDIMDEYGEDA